MMLARAIDFDLWRAYAASVLARCLDNGDDDGSRFATEVLALIAEVESPPELHVVPQTSRLHRRGLGLL